MRALTFIAPGSAALLDVDPPLPGQGDALVAPRHVGLCGTDSELLAGTMPYFSSGDAAFPLQPGHEVTGTVVSAPVSGPAAGTAVVVDPVVGCGSCAACVAGFPTRCADRKELGVRRGMPGGACELVAVPASNLHPIPDGVSSADAVLVEPGVTALNAVKQLGDLAEQRALVIGAGTLGLLASQMLASRGAAVDVVTIDDARRDLVERLGLHPLRDARPGTYPVVVEAAGHPAATRAALAAAAPGGHVALTGVQPAPVDGLDVNQVVLKDVTVFGVLNGPGLYREMLTELASGAVDAGALIDAAFELADAASALAALSLPNRAAPKILLEIPPPRNPS